jgi:hypothetical protein
MKPMPDKSPTTATEKRLLWMVRDLVAQGCTEYKKGDPISWDGPIPVFSQFVGKYAEAIALFAEYGLVTDLTDNGGRVVSGKLLSLMKTAEVLQTGIFDPRKEEAFQTSPGIGDYLG